MNSASKLKKKRSKKVPDLTSIQLVKDQQQLAAQQLCFISNFQDEFSQKKELNPEADIFNSVHFHSNNSPQCHSSSNNANKINFTHSPNKSAQVLQLEKYMDNKFIQQSRLLLKLYQTNINQNSFQSPTKLFAKPNKNSVNQKNDILTNSFKSDCVFVVKTMTLKQNTKEKKKVVKSQTQIPFKTQNFKIVPVQKGNNILRVSPLLQNYKSSEDWMTKSLQFSNTNKKQMKKYSLLEYQKIQSFKTMNNTINFKSQSYSKVNKKLLKSTIKYIKTDQNEKDSPMKQERNSNSFRRRFTFYQNQKTKTYQKYQRLID